MSPSRRRAGPVLGLLAVLGVIVGVALVVTGGEDAAPTRPTTTLPAEAARPRETLPLAGRTLTVTDVEDLSGLDVPEAAADFLSARLDNQRQLDVTFTMDPSEEATFLEASGLPDPVAGERVVTHSSPLWQLNPDAELRGVTDVTGDVVRAVELVPEGGRVRARIVITPA